jgi:hypothetical protein
MNNIVLIVLFLLIPTITEAQSDENIFKILNNDETKNADKENEFNKDEVYAVVGPSDSTMKKLRGDSLTIFLKEHERLTIKVNMYNASLIEMKNKTFNSNSKIIFKMINEKNEIIHTGFLLDKRILRPYLISSYFVTNFILLELRNLSEKNGEVLIRFP